MINCTVNIIYYMLCIEFEIVFYIWYIGQKLHDWSEINTYFWVIEKQAWADTKHENNIKTSWGWAVPS